jgi:copper oxidase (laccase) domain-containing protein
MHDDFGSEPTGILAAIGPCIRQCCYEVGVEVAEQFSPSYKTESTNEAKWKLDLAAANRNQLIESRILAHHIFDLGACTACEAKDFFSYRREPENPGRMISVIERIA